MKLKHRVIKRLKYSIIQRQTCYLHYVLTSSETADTTGNKSSYIVTAHIRGDRLLQDKIHM